MCPWDYTGSLAFSYYKDHNLRGPHGRRATVHVAVSLPGDTGRIVSGFRAVSRIYMFFDLFKWLRHGRGAYRSAKNVICIYEEVQISYFNYVVEKALKRKLHNDVVNREIRDCVQHNVK